MRSFKLLVVAAVCLMVTISLVPSVWRGWTGVIFQATQLRPAYSFPVEVQVAKFLWAGIKAIVLLLLTCALLETFRRSIKAWWAS